jgi:quinoprotein glucose dehydrogenase
MSALKLAKRCFNGGSSFVFEGLCYALSIAFMLGCQLQAEDRFDNTHDWAIYRGDKKGNQYSELAQIHAGNVTRLKPVWEYQTGDAGNRTSSYANPIMVDGMVYVSTPSLNAVAMDAETGKQLWFFDSSKYNPGGRRIQGRNRGVVYWEGAGGARIFVFVRNRVYAVDAKTGELISSFGRGGHIDLRYDLGVDPATASIECTSPGIVFEDTLIVGGRVPEGYVSTPGHIRGYNAITGAFEWIFHTIPQPGELGYETWEFVESEQYGGANPWGGFTVDEERGWVFCATGSPSFDFYGGFRKGMNLFGNCVLALDARTGERIWHYQTVHHDLWDMDNPSAPVLVTLKDGKERRDAVVQFTKMGLTFVLDRETGEPLFPTPEVPVPKSDIPGEEAWPTQPIPILPPPLIRLSVSEADLSRVTPEAYKHAKTLFDRYAKGPLYTPPTLHGNILAPGTLGGVEWHGGSFDPFLNTIYVNAHDSPGVFKLRKSVEPLANALNTEMERGLFVYQTYCQACHGANRQGLPPAVPSLFDSQKNPSEMASGIRNGQGLMPAFPQLSNAEIKDVIAFITSPQDTKIDIDQTGRRIRYHYEGYAQFNGPDGEPAVQPPWGTLNAIDLLRGSLLWRVPLGEYPALVKKGIRNTGARNFGGAVATVGGLVFIAGTPDEKIRAFEKHTGNLLWEYKLPAASYATPSIYMYKGRQYLVVTACGGGKNATPSGDSIIAFALDEEIPLKNESPPLVDDEGWTSLFDGATLNGWVHLNGSHNYTVEDGSIVGRTVPGSVNSFLCTTREFADFDLELEVAVDDVTNSGIQFRSKVRDVTVGEDWSLTAGRVNGPQAEIRRNQGPGVPTTGMFYGEALGTGWLSSQDKLSAGHDHFQNEGWNQLRIVAEGPRMRTWVNGQLVDDIIREDVYKTHPSGFIGLQVHGILDQGPFEMKFRNIRIREL